MVRIGNDAAKSDCIRGHNSECMETAESQVQCTVIPNVNPKVSTDIFVLDRVSDIVSGEEYCSHNIRCGATAVQYGGLLR